MTKIRYLCPGKNPNHWAFTLKRKGGECILDYEHGVSRTDRSFECNRSHAYLNPIFTENNNHECRISKINSAYSGYGIAIDHCNADEYGRLWVGNGEYLSFVAYCPHCGFKGEEL